MKLEVIAKPEVIKVRFLNSFFSMKLYFNFRIIKNLSNSSGSSCGRYYNCPLGSANEMNCPAGEYQPSRGQASCLPCDDGKICDPRYNDLVPENCPKGFSCGAGVGIDPERCPIGTYKDASGHRLYNQNENQKS